MKNIFLSIFLLFTVHSGNTIGQESKTVLVHYMPWFTSKPVSGSWGWHWTMKNCDPNSLNGDRRNIASHYYPLLGPYDSNDPDALECHVLLMKFAGIDGVVIDWYGIEDHWDYATNHRNSLHLVKWIKKAGLKFAICYEDQTVQHLIEAKVIQQDRGNDHAGKVVNWLVDNWFSDEAYVRLNDKPVLLVFGPLHYPGKQLKQITDAASDPPLLFALPHLSKSAGADGAFGWVPVDGGKRVEPVNWSDYLRRLNQRQSDGEPMIATAFPQFHDYYHEGEDRPSYGSIDHRNGKTFSETLDRAMRSESKIVQIATWNDFGEGTMIEPTREFGYQFLEKIQQTRNSTKKFSTTDLKLPVLLYRLRKKLTNDEAGKAKLDEASNLLFAGECESARDVLSRVDKPVKDK